MCTWRRAGWALRSAPPGRTARRSCHWSSLGRVSARWPNGWPVSMSSELVGLPPPRERPDRPVPPELVGNWAHGYNCRCVARHFGLDPAGYGEVPACTLSAAEYARLAADVD